jgi:carbon monoxide dehydrogenase subunit G
LDFYGAIIFKKPQFPGRQLIVTGTGKKEGGYFMFKKQIPAVIFLAVLFGAFSALAQDITMLEKTVEVGWFGIEKDFSLFDADKGAEGVIKVTSTTSDRFYFGYVAFNNRWHSISSRKTFSRKVSFKPKNHVRVFLFGQFRASAKITIVQSGQTSLLPEADLSAEPEIIIAGAASTLHWQTRHAEVITIAPGLGEVAPEGSTSVTPEETTTYSLTASNPEGSTTETQTIEVTHPPAVAITAPDGNDNRADKTFTITWSDADPDSNALINLYYDTDAEGENGTLIVSGLNEDPDGADDQYVWDTTSIADGDYHIYAVIDDKDHPPVTFYSDGPVTIAHAESPAFEPLGDQEVLEEQHLTFTVQARGGSGQTLTYAASNLPPGAGFDPESQTFSWTPAIGDAGEYSVKFNVFDGSLTGFMTVHITVAANPPGVTLTAEPETIEQGQAASLTWSSEYADACAITPDVGDVALNGSTSVSPAETTEYTINVSGPGGTGSDTATVTVLDALAHMTGTISDADIGQPLENAVVTVTAGEEMHSTQTRADGSYEIAEIAPGDIQVTITYDGHSQVYNVTLPSSGSYVMDFSIHVSGVRVTGTIIDASTNEPLSRAVVTASTDDEVFSASAAPDGSYEIAGIVVDGRLELTAACEGYQGQTVVYAVSGSGVLTHDFALFGESSAATVTGVVTNAKTLQPEPEVTVSISGTGIAGKTDGTGTFTLADVPMGAQRIHFLKADFISNSVQVDVNNDPFEVNMLWPSVNALANPARIKPGAALLVQDAVTGQPLENARVRLSGTGIQSVTGPDGSCTLEGLPSCPVSLEAMAENHKAVFLSPIVDPDGADALVFSMPPLTRGAVSGRVIDSGTGKPIANAQVASAENSLMGAATDADGCFTLVGIPSGVHALKAMHPEYLPETVSHVIVAHAHTSTANFSLTPRPVTGGLAGTVRDAQTGDPIAGALLEVEGVGAACTSNAQGGYVLSDVPAGLVHISITAEGFAPAERTAGVMADQNAATPIVTEIDFELDTHDPVPPVSVSEEIAASLGGSVEMPNGRFSLFIPPGVLSMDAIITVRSTQDGPDILPGDALDLDPALSMSGIRGVGSKIQVLVEPTGEEAEIPSLQGWVLIMSRYEQAAADAYNVAEQSIFPYYWDGQHWTLLRPKPYEAIVDPVNNMSVAVMNFSGTATGAAVTAGLTTRSPVLLASLHDHDPDMELASEYLFFEAGAEEAGENDPPPPGVVITDKDALDAVTGAGPSNKPNPNALPLLVIHGWDKKSIFTNTGPVDPNAGDRYSFLLEDLVDYNNGVYRPVFVSHNSRASMVSIGKDLGQKLHGTYLNKPGKIKGLPADPENPDSGSFSFVNTLGYSYGGLISRSYQAACQSVRNMNIIGTPNHGTYGVIFSLLPDSLVKRLLQASPGTADLLAYDDTKECASGNNPRLCMLNRNPDALPDQSMTLVAGTDSSWWSDILLEGENDRVVPVSSVFCRTSSPDDGETSLFPDEKIEKTAKYGFNHFNFSTDSFRFKDNPSLRDDIYQGLSDWVVSRTAEDPSTPYADNEVLFPDEEDEGYARTRVEVQYNCYGRDIDRVVLVIYYKDGQDNWHIAPSPDNGADTDGSLRSAKVETIATGNSVKRDKALALSATCTFPRVDPGDPTTEVRQVKYNVIRLVPGESSVSREPGGHFSTP